MTDAEWFAIYKEWMQEIDKRQQEEDRRFIEEYMEANNER